MLEKKVCILIIHGFYGGLYEVEFSANYLKENTNWYVEDIVLPGHSHKEDDPIYKTNYNMWIDFAKDKCEMLIENYDEVYVIGFSMGGVIASYLAALYNEVSKLVLLAPSFEYISLSQLQEDFRKIIFKDKIKEDEGLFNDLKFRTILKEIKAKTLIDFTRLVGEYKKSIKYVNVPTLIYHGELDELVPLKGAEFAYNNCHSKQKLLRKLKGIKHRICMSAEKENVTKEIIEFFQDSKKFIDKYKEKS